MKSGKRGNQIPQSIISGSVGHTRKNSSRENSNPSKHVLAQTSNLQSLLNNEKLQSMAQIQSESQPVLAKANDKPNILLSNNSSITVHRRNPSNQNIQQVSLSEVIITHLNLIQIATSSLSGSSAGAYMLKLQKYKKMKSELNNQTKSVIKKCLATNQQASGNQELSKGPMSTISQSTKSSNQNILGPTIAQSTKNSSTQQLIFNQFEPSQKENTNQIANSQSYLQIQQQQQQIKSQKSQKLKFSINNLLSELSQKTSNQNHLPHQNKPPVTQIHLNSENHNNSACQSKAMMQSIIAAKNHATLINHNQHVSQNASVTNKGSQQFASSKMMMALHKKCNSIATSNNVSNYITNARENSSKPSSSNVTCLVLDQENFNQQTQPLQKQFNNIVNGNTQSQKQYLQQQLQIQSQNQITQVQQLQQQLNHNQKKLVSQVSQIEFFDENVRVNHVPQITPRHQDKRKTITQPNERYKNLDLTGQYLQPQTVKNEYGIIPVSMMKDFNSNYQSKRESIQSQNIVSNQSRKLINHHEDYKVTHNKRYQDENEDTSNGSSLFDQKTAFEMKRRSCGPVSDQCLDNQFIQDHMKEQSMLLLQSQKLNGAGYANFGLRKFSQQVQFSNKLINKQEELQQQRQLSRNPSSHLYEEQQHVLRNPKDEIINFFSKYIKQTKFNDQNSLQNEDSEYEETIQNLKDFLQYLEDKSIINCKNLQNNQQEMTNLIQDLMKLDLNKFSNKVQPATTANTCKNSPKANSKVDEKNNKNISQNISNRRNSADFIPHQEFVEQADIGIGFQMNYKGVQDVKSPATDMEKNQNAPYRNKLPLNSPDQEYDNGGRSSSTDNTNNIVCYYAPVNVNGNGNIVNTNFQIFPQSHHVASQKLHNNHNKLFNCSQKLFNSNNNSQDGVQSPDALNDPQSMKYQHQLQQQQNLVYSQLIQNQQQFPNYMKQSQNHKRVNSIGSGLQNQNIQNILATPNNQYNSKINFAFGNSNQQQQYVVLDPQTNSRGYLSEKHDQLKGKYSKCDQSARSNQNHNHQQQQHFHQRKNSLFLQNDEEDIPLRQKFYPQNNQAATNEENDTDEGNEAVPFQAPKSRLTHRRATTNLIQPSQQLAKNTQTLQPPPPTQNQIITSNGSIYNDDIGLIEERDKLIKYIKLYTNKRLEVPVTTLDYYKFMKLIGKGAFGKVTLGIHKLTGKQVAIKTVDKSLMKDEYQKKKVLQEVHLLKKVRHQNVIRLLEVFESPKHLLMVMEYAGGGDLLQYVKKRRRLEEDEARKIFKQVVYGLAHCHCRSVLHRDIKLDNILLDNEGEIKICDFGVSRIIKKNQRITEQCGTPAYIAPEIISDSGYEGFNADVWSLGVLLYAMICGTVPFKAQNMHDLHQIITSGSFQYPPQIEPLLSDESKDLINKMLVLDPNERISIPEILSHQWMVSKDEMILQDDMIDLTNGTFLNRKDMYSLGSSSFPSQAINETQGEPDINQVQIDNLFLGSKSYQAKLSYTDYCAITQDFATMHMNEEALQVMEGMGFPRKIVRDGLNKGELNHATATYNLLVLN
ncbi:protein kinase domain containing protein [Stylonychia lemnae]|uniref:Protein kinase domain containing protein n=1 Tax=Stylonychia lemnae TaxID=5949 RepID=A0A078A9N4_STYLE|nr:protein kinase domain containing protein [Stylonychia lemnae]|eukprot:CDW77508.1 protein kinase domain containing protein [Stylonychia lemnae]